MVYHSGLPNDEYNGVEYGNTVFKPDCLHVPLLNQEENEEERKRERKER